MWRPNNILCLYSPEDDSKLIIEKAISVANNLQAKLTVACFMQESSGVRGFFSKGDPSESIADEQLQALEALASSMKGKLEIDCKVITGSTFTEVIQQVLKDEHDLILKAVEGAGTKDRFYSSYDMTLLRKCPCPVWLLKSDAKVEYKRILATIDVKDDYPSCELATRRELNLKVLQTAYSIALAESAELYIVSAWSVPHESRMRSSRRLNYSNDDIDQLVEETKSKYQQSYDSLLADAVSNLGEHITDYLSPQMALLKGDPKSLIPDHAEKINADLVVMGTVARTGIPGFIMGNTAESILNRLNQSVLAIKPPKFVSPVKV